MENPRTIDIDAFVEIIDLTVNPAFSHHTKEALTWLAKRQEYSHEYFRQLKRYSSQNKLEDALWTFDDVARIRFEAATLAFMQNIHAACDAFPFALHILLGGLSDRDDSEDAHFKWNRDLIKRVKQKFPEALDLHEELGRFMEDTHFRILASLVNQAKHKYFPRIRCEYDDASGQYYLRLRDVEYLCYPNGKKEKRVIDLVDVIDFAKTIHNETLVGLYRLYLLSYACVKSVS